jgi:hypothetical protein
MGMNLVNCGGGRRREEKGKDSPMMERKRGEGRRDRGKGTKRAGGGWGRRRE